MWLELLLCFVATVAFGIIFNVPARLLAVGGIIGVVAWSIYRLFPLYLGMNIIFSTALASFGAGLIAHLLARRKRVPVTTFTIPGIIPLVPGGKAYATMLAFVEEDYLSGLEQGVVTLLQAGAISGGLVFALSIFTIRKGLGQRYETHR